MEARFWDPKQRFKLVYGTEGVLRETVLVSPDSIPSNGACDGIFLSYGGNDETTGKPLWVLADGVAPAYPVLEAKIQTDGMAVEPGYVAVTIARGVVPAIVRLDCVAFVADNANYPTAPALGQRLKVVNGQLTPVALNGSEDRLAVAIIEQIHPTHIVIVKLY